MQVREHPLMSARTRRQLLQLPAAFMASRLGVSVTTYNRFERGERRAYLDQAHVIARCLGCAVDDLARDVDTEEQIDILKNRDQIKANITDESARELQHEREHHVAEEIQHELADRGFVTDVTEDQSGAALIAPGTVVGAHTQPAGDQSSSDEERQRQMLADWGGDPDDE